MLVCGFEQLEPAFEYPLPKDPAASGLAQARSRGIDSSCYLPQAIRWGRCPACAYLPRSTSLAAATMESGSKPNFRWSSLSGAEAPNVFMPMMRPDGPT